MGATGLEIQRLMDRPLNRWWRCVGFWWIRVYIGLSVVSLLLALLVRQVGPFVITGWVGTVEDWLTYAVSEHGYLLIIGAWLGAAHELRREMHKAFLETAAPDLAPQSTRPALFLATLRQGRWPLLAMLLVMALRVTADSVFPGSQVTVTAQVITTEILAELVSLLHLLALFTVLIVIYLLTGQRRVVWTLLAATALPLVYLAGLDEGLWQSLGRNPLIDPPQFDYGGVINVVFVALLLGGLAWGRGFLGRALVWLYAVGRLLSLAYEAIWPDTHYQGVHFEAWALGLLNAATASLAATGGRYIVDPIAHYVRIGQVNYTLVATDEVTAQFVLAVVGLIWLAVVGLVSYFVVLRMVPALTAPRTPGDGWGNPGYRQRWRDFALVCSGLVLVFWELVPCGDNMPMIGPMPDPGPPVERHGLPSQALSSDVTDQRIAGLTIIEGLQAYFADQGEYPPYLFGAKNQIYPNLGWWETGAQRGRYTTREKLHNIKRSRPDNYPPDLQSLYWVHNKGAVRNPDPLIAEGYFGVYASGLGMPFIGLRSLADLTLAQGDYGYCCLFSTPGDHAVLGGPSPMLYDAIFEHSGERTPAQAEVVMQSMDPASYEATRHLALGGRLTWHFPLRFDAHYSLFPRRDEERINGLYEGAHPVRDHYGMCYFGYQRGEWYGGSEREAWLWFYGPNEWAASREQDPAIDTDYPGESGQEPGATEYILFPRLIPLRGLDLLNARTGELEPDGVPDGICLLYKLRDGEVGEVVDAPDL